jgi:ABC-type multidrug transport system ATPase subunit
VKIKVDRISKRYGSLRALHGVSFEVAPGQIVAVVGPNGAGKTTLLRCLASIVPPDEGKILYDGEPFVRYRTDLRRRLHFLPDTPPMFPTMTVLRHLAMALRLYEADGDGAEERVLELLREFDLLPLAEMTLQLLSRGQSYKAFLTALLAVDPELWLLDEPFASGMDPHGISAFKTRAREATKRGRTIIFTTQLLEVAERFADHMCVLHRGEAVLFESVERLQARLDKEGGALEEIFRQLREVRL